MAFETQTTEAKLQAAERRLAVLRAIAAAPGLSPDGLRAAVAEASGRRWGQATLYEDVAVLKGLGLLADARHRQGYHLAGAGYAPDELRMLLDGLRLQAEDLANPQARALHTKLRRRAGVGTGGGLAAEAIANRPVMRTGEDFADLMAHLREPLLRGQVVEVAMKRNPWEPDEAPRRHRLHPLQFIFHDVAWYLLAEDLGTRKFVTLRLDRLNPAIAIEEGPGRGEAAQARRQAEARELLRRGWGMAMPQHEPSGKLRAPVERFELRFKPDAARFVEEGPLRHESQRTKREPDGSLAFSVDLPVDPTVVFQFRRWVLSWGAGAAPVGPAWFREQLRAELIALLAEPPMS